MEVLWGIWKRSGRPLSTLEGEGLPQPAEGLKLLLDTTRLRPPGAIMMPWLTLLRAEGSACRGAPAAGRLAAAAGTARHQRRKAGSRWVRSSKGEVSPTRGLSHPGQTCCAPPTKVRPRSERGGSPGGSDGAAGAAPGGCGWGLSL